MPETNLNQPLKGKPSRLCILGIPMDLGQTRRGVDMGPSAIRNANLNTVLTRLDPTEEELKGLTVAERDELERIERRIEEIDDRGDVKVEIPEALEGDTTKPFDEETEEKTRHVEKKTRHVGTIRDVCRSVATEASNICSDGYFPIFLGGDHSLSIGTVAGVATAAEPKTTGVIWLDAHADFNTPETTPSGNAHGMSLAVLTGRGDPELRAVNEKRPSVKHENVVLLGLRSLDYRERKSLRDWGAAVYETDDRKGRCCIYTMEDIDRHGVRAVVERVLQDLDNVDRVHLSFDLDSMDSRLAPGVGTPVDGGLTYREAHIIMERLNEWGKITSLDIVEVNPTLDHENRTARLAVDLTASLMGRRRYGLSA